MMTLPMDRETYRQAAREYFADRAQRGVFSDNERRVPLRGRRIAEAAPSSTREARRQEDEQPMEVLLAGAKPRTVVIGRPGAGKTTALLLHALALAEAASGPLPVYVSLRELDGGYQDLEKLIEESMQRVDREAKLADLRSGEWVLLLDGVNEHVARGDPLLRLQANFTDLSMIFASREAASGLGEAIEVLPLAKEDRDATLKALLPDHAEALQRRLASDPGLDELSRTPLLLALLCDAVRGGLTPEATRSALIRASVASHTGRYQRSVGREALTAHDLDRVLSTLAFEMLTRGSLRISERDAEVALAALEPKRSNLLAQLSVFHLLGSAGDGELEFVHPLVTEYYAAQHLRAVGLPERRALLRDFLNRTLWTEALRLFAEECDDLETAGRLVDAAGAVDTILAARLVGAFPPPHQAQLIERLVREGDPPGTRLTRAFAVGTAAAASEFRRLAADADQEVRFQLADGLWDVSGLEISLINADLLTDTSLSVVNVAAHNLRRHPAPVTALLAALAREDVWTTTYLSALPRLVAALLGSDTPQAGEKSVELARCFLARSPPDDPIGGTRVHDVVRNAFFGEASPHVIRALSVILHELGEEPQRIVIDLLRRSGKVTDLTPALDALPMDRRRDLLETCLASPDSFTVPDTHLFEVLRATTYFGWGQDRLLASAIARRCAGLDDWLVRLVIGEELREGDYVGELALSCLIEIDPAVAARASAQALRSGDESIRHGIAWALINEQRPAELQDLGYAAVSADQSLAEEVIRYGALKVAMELIEAALERRQPDEYRSLIEAFWTRRDVTPLVTALRDAKARRELRSWPPTLPVMMRRVFSRSALESADQELTDAFLASTLWHGDPVQTLVVAALERILDSDDQVRVAQALRHLYEVEWRPSLAMFIRLLQRGHQRHRLHRPEIDEEVLFDALEPLLTDDDPSVRAQAFESIGRIPEGRIDAFAALLEIPDLACRVARRLVSASCHRLFPELLGRGDLIAPPPEENLELPIDSFADREKRRIDWSTFKMYLERAPSDILQACLSILVTRDEPTWDRPFLDLFERAPRIEYCARVVASILRSKSPFADERPLRALIGCAVSAEDFEFLERGLADPSLSTLTIAHIYAEVAAPACAPFVATRLTELINHGGPNDPEADWRSIATWWIRLLGRVGSSRDAERLRGLAARTTDVWLSREFYRQAAEIHRRTGIYSTRYATESRSWTLLHLSDLHFSADNQAERWYSALAEDLRRELGLSQLDAVVLSGDIVDRAHPAGYAAAARFVDTLRRDFNVDRDRVVIVPGNHDVDRALADPAILEVETTPLPQRTKSHFTVGRKNYVIVDHDLYDRRLAAFADFFSRALGRGYPLSPNSPAPIWVWPELEVVALGLSSVPELDGLRKDHATVDDIALGAALAGLDGETDHYLKIAVVHHPLNGPGDDRIRDRDFLGRLAVAGFSLVLHGHVHHDDRELYRHDCTIDGRRLEIIGAGTFGARSVELPTGVSWQYNLLRFNGDRVRVETRRRASESGPWGPFAYWPRGPRAAPQAWYELDLEQDRVARLGSSSK